jgi:exportin-1
VQRSAADSILRDLHNDPDLWLEVMHILENTQKLNTKFFALQVRLFNNPLSKESLEFFD